MDPISLIVAALATGAAAGLQPTAETLIKDAYEGLKSLIKRKYERMSADVLALETDPASDARKAVVQESLEKEGAASDEDVLLQAQTVLKAIEEHRPDLVGVLLEDLKVGANVTISDIISAGPGVQIKRSKIDRDLTIDGVRSGQDPPAS